MLFVKTPFSNTQDFDRVFQQTAVPIFPHIFIESSKPNYGWVCRNY